MHNRDIARRGPTANLLNHDTQFHKQRDTTGHSMWLLNPHALARTITLRILDWQVSSWLYLTTFNGLWVVVPLWILYEAYQAMSSAMSQAEMVDLVNYLKKDD